LTLGLRRKNSWFDKFKTVGQALLDIKFIVRLCLTYKLLREVVTSLSK